MVQVYPPSHPSTWGAKAEGSDSRPPPKKKWPLIGSPHVINRENFGPGMGGWGLVEGVLARLTVP